MATNIKDRMVSREEYARVIESFMMEMPGLCMTHNEAALRRLPALGPELDEYLAQLRDPSLSADKVLATAFGFVDEFVGAAWDEVITESYALYVDLAGGRSHQHPEGGEPTSDAPAI